MKEVTIQADWDDRINATGGHPLQLWGWGDVKASHGWSVHRFVIDERGETGVQVLVRPLPAPFRAIAYIPRPQMGNWTSDTTEIKKWLQSTYGAVCLKVEPDTEQVSLSSPWRASKQTILLKQTVILDLTKTEEELLAAMAKKTRQYIRKSSADVRVRRAGAGDIANCLKIYHQTAARANFSLHDDSYYRDVFDKLGEHSPIFVAENASSGSIVAFLWLAASSETAFELYGGVTDEGQALRANYALKWQAIQQLKTQGVVRYDLNGLLNDGISDFKRSFSDVETTLAGTYDLPLSPFYPLWNSVLPAGKRASRALRKLSKR